MKRNRKQALDQVEEVRDYFDKLKKISPAFQKDITLLESSRKDKDGANHHLKTDIHREIYNLFWNASQRGFLADLQRKYNYQTKPAKIHSKDPFVIKIDSSAPLDIILISVYGLLPRSRKKVTPKTPVVSVFPEDGYYFDVDGYLSFRIMPAPKRVILSQIKTILQKKFRRSSKRFRVKEGKKTLELLQGRFLKKSLNQLSRDSGLKLETIKKRIYSRRKLIINDDTPLKKIEIKIEHLKKGCGVCTEWGTCIQLCQEVEPFINQDHVYSRESLQR